MAHGWSGSDEHRRKTLSSSQSIAVRPARPLVHDSTRLAGCASHLPEGHSNVSLRWMERLIVTRHAESEYNVKGLINADPLSLRSPLTRLGTDQARSMAKRLAANHIDLCVTRDAPGHPDR